MEKRCDRAVTFRGHFAVAVPRIHTFPGYEHCLGTPHFLGVLRVEPFRKI